MPRRGRWLLRNAVALSILSLLCGLLSAPPASADPQQLAAPTSTTISQRSTMAVVTWPAVPEAAGYAIDCDTSPGFVTARNFTSAGTLAVLTGLDPSTGYYVRVAAVDAATKAIGPWGPAATFITADREYSLSPPVLTSSAATTTSLTVAWKRVGPKLQYDIAVGKTADTVATTQRVSGLTTVVDKLEKVTKYYLSARAVKPDGTPVTAWSPAVAFATPAEMPLRVASFNIKCANCKQGGELAWPQRKAAVAATIRSQAPDVIGLQEASPSRLHGRSVSQYQDLLRELGSPYKVTLTGGAGVDNRILYNSDKVKLLRTGVVALPKGGGRRFMVWAVFKQISTGKEFLFADTHLSPGKSKGGLRVRQTKKVISTLKRLSTKNMPAITVGDFNMFKWMGGNGYQPYKMMVSSGYLDPLGNTYRSHSASSSAFVENRIRTNFSTFNDFKRAAPAFSYDNGTQLDFIFVTKMRVSEWETVVNVDDNGRFVGTIPSDHNMVRATVWLP